MSKMEMSAEMPSEGMKVTRVLLDSSSREARGVHPFYYREKKEYWHKFKVLGGSSYEKEVILTTIMDYMEPMALIPVMYNEEGPDCSFLSRNCMPAIKRLLLTCGLELKLPDGCILQMQVELFYENISKLRVNMREILIKVIVKRYDAKAKHLDLSNYHMDPDLVNIIFCPLSRPKILHYILTAVIKSAAPFLKSMSLSDNELTSLEEFQHWHYALLRRLDLRYNKIPHLTDVKNLRLLKLEELYLDQNPLCQEYQEEGSYINDIREILPTLVKLDGVTLGPPGLPRTRRNFLIKPESYNLADQFTRYYFSLYDREDRSSLKGLYHRNAFFSLTSTYLPAQSTSNTARLTEYTIQSRNLLKICDYSKTLRLLHHGPEDILDTICKLPRSEHDPLSFTVDLIESVYGTVITVSGVFREPATIKTPLNRSFSRVFVLVQVGHCEYQIVNEMVHIKNATTEENEEAFKKVRPKFLTSDPEKLTDSDRDQMTEAFCQITEMNFKWSRKCLEESKWDIKEALTVFTELYKIGKIPDEAFSK